MLKLKKKKIKCEIFSFYLSKLKKKKICEISLLSKI